MLTATSSGRWVYLVFLEAFSGPGCPEVLRNDVMKTSSLPS